MAPFQGAGSARLHGARPITDFDRKIGQVVLRASELAMADVANGSRHSTFKVVCAPTGSGKSTSAAAVAAALFRLDPHFACAFVVETVRQCEEVFKLVAELLPEAVARRQAVVWSTSHDERADDEVTQREYGFRPLRKFLHDDLKAARIVVVTHKKWLGEIRHGSDAGVRRYRGRRRDLIYIDEHPELVTLVDQQPHQVLAFRDALYGTDPEHPWSQAWGPILEQVVARMNEAFRSDGAAYVPVELVTPEEVAAFGGVLDHDLLGFTKGTDPERRRAEAARMEQTVRFLRAAANGCVFLSRQEPLMGKSINGIQTLFGHSLECAPRAGQIRRLELTGHAGLSEDGSHGQAPLPQHRVQAPGRAGVHRRRDAARPRQAARPLGKRYHIRLP